MDILIDGFVQRYSLFIRSVSGAVVKAVSNKPTCTQVRDITRDTLVTFRDPGVAKFVYCSLTLQLSLAYYPPNATGGKRVTFLPMHSHILWRSQSSTWMDGMREGRAGGQQQRNRDKENTHAATVQGRRRQPVHPSTDMYRRHTM